MNLVKEYKGVKIFVSTLGEFYCDAIKNSNDYKVKTFSSNKLQSIEKAIDDFKGQEIDGNEYYEIESYKSKVTPLKVVRKVGSRLFFNDGTDSSNYSRRHLYPKNVDEKQEFVDLVKLFAQIKVNTDEIDKLYEINRRLKANADAKLRCLPQVAVS